MIGGTVALRSIAGVNESEHGCLTLVVCASVNGLVLSVTVRDPSGAPVQIGPEVGGRSDCGRVLNGTAGDWGLAEPGCPLADSGDRFPETEGMAGQMTNAGGHSLAPRG